MCNTRKEITPHLVKELNKLPDLDLTNLSVPDCVLRIKDLSHYPTDRDGAIDHNTYFVWYKNGTGEGVNRNKEQSNQWFANFWENKQGEDL